jgi:hypothetical protein
MMRDVKLSEEDRKIYNSWLRIVMGLISPFGIMFLILIIYNVAGGKTSQEQGQSKVQMQQAQRGIQAR